MIDCLVTGVQFLGHLTTSSNVTKRSHEGHVEVHIIFRPDELCVVDHEIHDNLETRWTAAQFERLQICCHEVRAKL